MGLCEEIQTNQDVKSLSKYYRPWDRISYGLYSRRPILEIIGQLRNESGTASNIKSDLTRTHAKMH